MVAVEGRVKTKEKDDWVEMGNEAGTRLQRSPHIEESKGRKNVFY